MDKRSQVETELVYSLYLNNCFVLVIEKSLLNHWCHSVVDFLKTEFRVLKNLMFYSFLCISFYDFVYKVTMLFIKKQS